MLLPTEVDSFLKKKGRKRNLIRLGGSNSGKVVFILLTEVIILNVGSTAIDIRESGIVLIPR